MPTYTIYNKKTKKTEDIFMSIVDMETKVKPSKNLTLVPTAPRIVSGVDGIRRTDDSFNDLLKNIKKHNRGSTIKTR